MLNTSPINLDKWLQENSELLQPPVNNYCLHRGGFTVMIVGGPNERTDYHINPTPEWFHQKKGHMTLKVVDETLEGEDRFKDVTINEGDSFLLPANVPHNPVRYSGTVGIVVEQDRPAGQDDHLRWYCSNCKEIVCQFDFEMKDLGTQVKEGILKFEESEELRTCKECGTLNYSKPQ
ncbi:HBL236Wp [Eremothecium sinecaudum]|uniref:3-hydroxyanthranilate 3,4-dioxygenase n=1 Tax=Eremothecium sinecaudum TaxID=45286 RepID=A0A125RDV1_9SACH|nr:HBL236Wp [Eremothecium sinecaudum]AMD18666.1 HBL236Wp [Eremothecium sinecaudum]